MSRDVSAISRLLSSRIYNAARIFYSFREREREREIVECSKKTLFCGDCCDRNQVIILVVFGFGWSDIYIVKCFSFCI